MGLRKLWAPRLPAGRRRFRLSACALPPGASPFPPSRAPRALIRSGDLMGGDAREEMPSVGSAVRSVVRFRVGNRSTVTAAPGPLRSTLCSTIWRRWDSGAPRVAGFDGRGRRSSTWVEGTAPLLPWPAWMTSDRALATSAPCSPLSQRPWPDRGARTQHRGGPGWGRRVAPVTRDGDLWPSNVVSVQGDWWALIDWGFAAARHGHRRRGASVAKH